MPSGRTHDSITLWSLPLIAGLTLARTHSSSLTLFVSGGYLFSGLMFGPDLDVYSHHYKRWGALRWLWLPYRRSMRHRSFWSHGPIVGTIVRVVYLSLWAGAFGITGLSIGAIACQIAGITPDWSLLAQQWSSSSLAVVGRSFQTYPGEAIAIAIGLELGAMSHVFSDWALSAYRRAISRRTPKNLALSRKGALSAEPSSLPSAKSTLEQPTLPNQVKSNQANRSIVPPTRREPQLPPFGRRRDEGEE